MIYYWSNEADGTEIRFMSFGAGMPRYSCRSAPVYALLFSGTDIESGT